MKHRPIRARHANHVMKRWYHVRHIEPYWRTWSLYVLFYFLSEVYSKMPIRALTNSQTLKRFVTLRSKQKNSLKQTDFQDLVSKWRLLDYMVNDLQSQPTQGPELRNQL